MRNVIKQTSHSAPSAKQADSLPSKAGQKRKTNYSRGSSTQRIKSLSKTTKRSHHTEKVAVRSGDGQKHTRGRDRTQAPKRKQRKMSKNPQTLGGRDQVTLNRDGSTKSPRKPRNQGDSKPARSSETKIKEASPKTMLETRGGPQNDVQGSFTSPRKKNNNTNENASADGEATATTYSLVVEVERVPESSRFRAWGFLRRIKTVAKKKSKADFEINDSALQTKNGTHKVTKRSFRYLPRILRRSHRVRARSSGVFDENDGSVGEHTSISDSNYQLDAVISDEISRSFNSITNSLEDLVIKIPKSVGEKEHGQNLIFQITNMGRSISKRYMSCASDSATIKGGLVHNQEQEVLEDDHLTRLSTSIAAVYRNLTSCNAIGFQETGSVSERLVDGLSEVEDFQTLRTRQELRKLQSLLTNLDSTIAESIVTDAEERFAAYLKATRVRSVKASRE